MATTQHTIFRSLCLSFVWLELVFGNVPLSIERLPAIVPSSHTLCAQGKTEQIDRQAERDFSICVQISFFFFYFFFCVIFLFFFYFTFAENHNSYLSYLVSWNVLFCGRAVAVAIVVGKPHALIYFSYILYICVWIYKTYRPEYMYV